MNEVLVVLDLPEEGVTRHARELLTLARDLGTVVVLVVTDRAVDPAAEDVLRAHGASRVIEARPDEGLAAGYLVGPVLDALDPVVRELGSGLRGILLPATFVGREVAGRLAVRLDTGVVTDAAAAELDEAGRIVVTKSVFAGSWSTHAVVPDGPAVVTVRPGVVRAVRAEPPAGPPLERRSFTISPASRAVVVHADTEHQREEATSLSITSADVIVSGGRGTNGDFGPVVDLADALGAAVGASRVAVDAGWAPHSAQVGQTGSVVSPEVYVAAGISGAIQHRAGMQTSKTVVVVNSDRGAPLFDLADFGVVGDLATILPRAGALIRAARGGEPTEPPGPTDPPASSVPTDPTDPTEGASPS